MYNSDCRKCKKVVKWVACQICDDWFHTTCLGWKFTKYHTLMQETNVWYLCEPCKKKTMKELVIKGDNKDEGNRDSADDTEPEDEGNGTKEAPKENNTVR